MAQVNGAPWTLEWGGVVINGVSEVDTSGVEQPVEEVELIDGSTQYFNGQAKGSVNATFSSQDVVEIKKALADNFVALAGTLADGTTVTATDGLIEISNTCSATATTAPFQLKSCDGNVRLNLQSCRVFFESFGLSDRGDEVTVRFASTATSTIGWIGNQ